jgi:hypothetical protein
MVAHDANSLEVVSVGAFNSFGEYVESSVSLQFHNQIIIIIVK